MQIKSNMFCFPLVWPLLPGGPCGEGRQCGQQQLLPRQWWGPWGGWTPRPRRERKPKGVVREQGKTLPSQSGMPLSVPCPAVLTGSEPPAGGIGSGAWWPSRSVQTWLCKWSGVGVTLGALVFPLAPPVCLHFSPGSFPVSSCLGRAAFPPSWRALRCEE